MKHDGGRRVMVVMQKSSQLISLMQCIQTMCGRKEITFHQFKIIQFNTLQRADDDNWRFEVRFSCRAAIRRWFVPCHEPLCFKDNTKLWLILIWILCALCWWCCEWSRSVDLRRIENNWSCTWAVVHFLRKVTSSRRIFPWCVSTAGYEKIDVFPMILWNDDVGMQQQFQTHIHTIDSFLYNVNLTCVLQLGFVVFYNYYKVYRSNDDESVICAWILDTFVLLCPLWEILPVLVFVGCTIRFLCRILRDEVI